MIPLTVLVTAQRLAAPGLALLDAAGARVIFLSGAGDASEVEALMSTEPVNAVISRTVTLSAKAIESCPTLRVISKHGVGVSNIDVAAATARGIPVYVTPGANAASVAELTMALMLAASRKMGYMDRELHAGRWTRCQDGMELGGRTLGLVGFGEIGQRVARMAMAMDMQIHVFDPVVTSKPEGLGAVTLHERLDDLLPRCQVLSLHVPLTEKTRNLIGRQQIQALPRGAVVVNTARGEVVDEDALIEALGTGQLHAAGLDTMAQEPLPPDHALARLDNVILTPHVGGSTPGALAAMASGAARNVLGWLQGKPVPPSACVNPTVLSPTFSESLQA